LGPVKPLKCLFTVSATPVKGLSSGSSIVMFAIFMFSVPGMCAAPVFKYSFSGYFSFGDVLLRTAGDCPDEADTLGAAGDFLAGAGD